MALDTHISELLYKHDCVIIPALGGFVANYQPAKINGIQNTFYPPSKSISFNRSLINNDGLLANHVAQKEKVSYPNACKRVEQEVANINVNLKNKKRVLLKDVGTLFLDSENRLQFEPAENVNFLLDAYGLTVFQKQPIKRVTLEEKITKEFKDRTVPLTVVGEEKKSSKKWVVAAAITIPLAFFAIWIPNKYDLGSNINYANLNPFTPDVKTVYEPNNTSLNISSEEENRESIKDKIALAGANDLYLEIKINEADYVVRLNDKIIAEAESTYVATRKKELHYHIVGGCFSSKVNAKKMVRRLKKEGFDANIVGKRKGLWTVSYNSFATRREAVQFLSEAKDHNKKAWVLNY
ncbi:MAG: SPOR domain-containing protein [Vicingaceae bacterium]|nr:SPOR domain-containing protein [Vicingaceae bacterium]